MCSVTFWPRHRGYVLGINRDESLVRVAGLPPARYLIGGRSVVNPREPSGGTWIAVNDAAVCFALINWYSIAARAEPPTVSRGQVVTSLRDVTSLAETVSRLGGMPLGQINPFRLIGVFEPERVVCEWRWDRRELTCVHRRWAPNQWQSSGHDEAAAQRARGETFELARDDHDAGSVPWLRRLHGSHAPVIGPFSTCMHRADAATVSYTEVEVTDADAVMCHSAGPLCCARELTELRLVRVRTTAVSAVGFGVRPLSSHADIATCPAGWPT